MAITPIGWFLIPLGISMFIVRPQWLYVLTVFFAPFSATSVINAGASGSGQGFSPYLLFGLLLVLRQSGDAVLRMKVRIKRGATYPLSLLYLFAGVCLTSLVMPLIINGRLQVMSEPSLDYRLIPLEYSWQILNHALRLLLDISLTTIIVYRNLTLKSFYASVRVYLCSGVFISLWGVMQSALYILGIPYPDFIFNNSYSPGATAYGSVLESVNLLRVSSVAIEPSFLSRVLVGMLALSVVTALRRHYIFNKVVDWLVITLLFFTTLLTTSSTGFVGIAIVLTMLLILPRAVMAGHQGFRKIALGAMAAVLLCYLFIPSVKDILDSQVLYKGEGGSALERAVIISNDLGYFLKYPVLGVGWNCVPMHDVIIGMLASCGLIGLLAFLFLIGTVIRRLKRSSSIPAFQRALDNPSAMMFVCLSATCSVYVISGQITVPDFWVILSLSIAAVKLGDDLRREARERRMELATQ